MSPLKPERPPATSSIEHVAMVGLVRVAAAQLVARLGAKSRVSVPLLVSQSASGLPELVHAHTGQKFGICANASVARSTKGFFG
jgi:hypothetical protein